MMKQCSVDGCGSSVLAKDLCRKHYNRMRSKGSVSDVRANAAKICARPDCDAKATVHGLCQNHKERPKVSHGYRECMFCGNPIPKHRNARAIFCSVQCKTKDRTASGKGAISARNSALMIAYGLTVEQIDEMAKGGCQICGTKEWGGRWGRPCVDHNHDTGKVRGILCDACNNGIGKLQDDPVLLEAAVRYLRGV
jgi:endogenous inhibitor of DNA gyrase (YacG/DUF329 family)